MNQFFAFLLSVLVGLNGLLAQPEKAVTEDDYYTIITLPIPTDLTLEVGGLVSLPNGNLAASTRYGDVYIIENPYMENGSTPHYRQFATGMHEILGLAYKDETFYLAQRGELTRLWDKNGDGMADLYEAVYVLPVSGHYHEYSYGPVIMDDGSMFVTGNVAFGDQEWWRGESRVPWRGWAIRISPEGEMEPWATGMRSPCGLGEIDGEFFYCDNQGDWMGSGGLVHVEKGDFTGHPAGLRWAEEPESPVKLTSDQLYATVDPHFTPPGKAPVKPQNDPDEVPVPLFEVAEKFPMIKTPAVWLPHSVLGISTSDIIVDETGGDFGPFAGQVFIGDQGQSKISRVFLEKVNGTYQGAAFSFRDGFESGVLRMCWGKDGSMFVGQTNRGWGSTGPKPYGLQRLVWTGKTPFEMKAIRAMPDGFEVEFTQPVDKATAQNPDNYQVSSFIYKYHPVYGSPVVNDKEHFIQGVLVSNDGLKARLVVDSIRQKYVHEITATGVRSYYDGRGLLHPTGYYTLNEVPEGSKLNISRPRPNKSSAEAMPAHEHKAEATPPPAPPKKVAATRRDVTPTVVAPKRQTRMPASWTDGPDQAVSLGTRPGLQYDTKLITVQAGSRIKWTFNNNDDMPHNCVIVKPGTADGVGNAAIKLGVKGMNMNYIPPSDNILFHTKLLQPAISESIYFVAPEQPGDYTFVCTVPGHAQIMRGVLRVLE